jgi:hypothetical protein
LEDVASVSLQRESREFPPSRFRRDRRHYGADAGGDGEDAPGLLDRSGSATRPAVRIDARDGASVVPRVRPDTARLKRPFLSLLRCCSVE